ncbi:MBL fold metallo-hydrolase [Nannocystis punicea]|uniref:MBL fold metallo-hydrolase n=1 Tax=Nannocystis punicea TaxID=2995304 RepID=A0ABY7H6B5_9BACT|nr:MBL fold metallo-hydrolase [Nannocystis poenicansa]WAS94600.1 MBL fold metallo-hydrolase [Nannocystis poenicansa]
MATYHMRLRDEIGLQVRYADSTRYGSGVTGLVDALVARMCAPLLALARREGPARLVERSAEFMPRMFAGQALGGLYAAPDVLREECLYPDPARVTPAALVVRGLGPAGEGSLALPLHREAAELADVVAALDRGCPRPLGGLGARLWDALLDAGALTRETADERALADGVTAVGHATVAVQHAGARLVVDPFAAPPLPGEAPRPLPCRALRPDLVLVTHGHPAHFDLHALLRFGADTPIVVPAVARESLLSVDMALRLRQLGFRRVIPLSWRDAVQVGPFHVVVLPFFGEQPTSGEFLHPEARNLGNTYLIEVAGRRVACIADAGADAAGDTITMARAAARRHGRLDVLFGGYRAWRPHPIELLGTSMARYLLQVPRAQWGTRQQLTPDADDLLAAAQAWQARTVVPYANGGAPWLARLGLGPRGADSPSFDPDLAAVRQAAARAPNAPTVRALRPGERMELFG